jgi:two-component system response regulator PilR (NtrC family)
MYHLDMPEATVDGRPEAAFGRGLAPSTWRAWAYRCTLRGVYGRPPPGAMPATCGNLPGRESGSGDGIMARILVVDDEPGIREMLGVLLRRAGHDPVAVEGAVAALARIERDAPFEAVVTDLSMPDGSGMDVLSAARRRDPSTEVIMITAYATTEAAVAAMRSGAYDYLRKPFDNATLLATLEKALEKRALSRENELLREQALARLGRGGLVGQSAAIQRIAQLIDRIANGRTSVLITGESGTGKEMVARAIHERGDRHAGPLIVVNCGALPEALMESELFGHERGAFTGATARKEGLFRAAAGGTIFLDEVGELPPGLQVKLLRVLQERRVRPVGAEKEVDVDVRVVAATNRDLEAEVAAGRFRQDLFYRLNVIRIVVPPLRERREDIPLLAEHFLRKHGALAGRRLSLAPEAARWLMQRTWPGNVRELENVIERAVALALGDRVTLADLTDEAAGPVPPAAPPLVALPAEGLDLDAYLADVERRLLLEALARAGGVRTRAAALLRMSFRSFRYRLSKFGLGGGDDVASDEVVDEVGDSAGTGGGSEEPDAGT